MANTPAPTTALAPPPEFSPLPPAIDPVPVRRAVALPVRRAVAVAPAPIAPQPSLADNIPVRRALPVTNAGG